MKLLKRYGSLLLALVCICTMLSACQPEEETETVYYTVTFDSVGGTAIEQKMVEEGKQMSEPNPPTKEGYLFDGWRTEGGGKWDFSTDVVVADMTLQAIWIDPSVIFSYQVENGEVTITGLKRTRGALTVPSMMGGLPVTAIADGAFYELGSETVQSITLPQTITTIGEEAFYGCNKISIVFDEHAVLTSVGEGAFYGCDGLAAVRLGEGITKIAPDTFAGCRSLKEIRLPQSVTVLDENAFSDCTALRSVIFYENLSEICDSAFKDCDSLTALYFHGTLSELTALRASTANQNDPFLDATAYFYSATAPVSEGNYWYFNENNNPQLW